MAKIGTDKFFFEVFDESGNVNKVLMENVLSELKPVFKEIEADAKRRCPVRGEESRATKPAVKRKNKERKVQKSGKTRKQAGSLRESIRSRVVVRDDKTAVIGYLEAGDDKQKGIKDLYYASFIELGARQLKKDHSFLRPAFYAAANKLKTACNNAVKRTTT